MTDFSQAVERFVQSTKNADFIANLHTIYKQIQASNADDVVSIFHTLSAMKHAGMSAFLNDSLGIGEKAALETQINNMQKACASRVAQLILTDRKANSWMGVLFDNMEHSELNSSNGKDVIKAVLHH